MSYLLIVDDNEDRSDEITKKCQENLPHIKVYKQFFNPAMQEYNYFYYQPDIEDFKKSPLPSEPAILALWHYRNDDDDPNIFPKISVGFGGTGKEPNSNFKFHISSKLNFDDVATVLTSEKIIELWNWACDEKRSDKSLPSLIRDYDPALLALQILCKGYLKVYDDLALPTANAKIIAEQCKLVNTREWWLAPFNTVEDLQSHFTHDTKILNNPIGELVEAIQQPDLWTDPNQQKLRQICLQCLKV